MKNCITNKYFVSSRSLLRILVLIDGVYHQNVIDKPTQAVVYSDQGQLTVKGSSNRMLPRF